MTELAEASIAGVAAERLRRRLTSAPGLVEACDDVDLFGIPLWPKQRELLAEIGAGPRVQVLALGRRASKTTMMALVGLWCCLLRPQLRLPLRPGECGYAIGVATTLKQAELMVAAARSIVERSPMLAGMVDASTRSEIRFTNGTAFTAFPCTSRGGRGWPVFALLMDEVAHFLDTDGNSAAENVWQAFVPATAQFGDDARIIVSSTPWGSTGLFADLYGQAVAGEIPAARAHHATSVEVNPTLTVDFLEQERLVLGADQYAAEYLADFVAGGGAFLDADQIRAAVVDRPPLDPSAATSWVAGLDPAFSSDPFGLAIVGRDNDRQKLVLGLSRRWLPQGGDGSFEGTRATQDAVLDEVAEECLRFNATVVTDQHLAPAVTDRLRRAGLSITVEPMTATSKTAAFSELRARLSAGALELYSERQLLDELRRLRSKFTAGQASVLNPRMGDSHGDLAQALALAVWKHRSWRPGAVSRSLSAAGLRVPTARRLA